jgi:hypothetical protein
VADGELGDLLAAVRVAHGGDELAHLDLAPALPHGLDAGFEAFLHSLDGLIQREALLEMLLRRPPHLAVHHAVVSEVLNELLGHAEQALVGLHDSYGVVEGLQVPDQGT